MKIKLVLPLALLGLLLSSCNTTLNKVEPAEVSISPDALKLEVGDVGSLTALVSPSNASSKAVTWSTLDDSVAKVSVLGVVTATGIGSTEITAKVRNYTDIQDTITVTVVESIVRITSITLTPTTLSLNAGDTSQINATILPNNASNKSLLWTSSNNSIATISSSGLVTAIKEGSVTITAASPDDNKIKATCSVSVSSVNKPVTKIVISPSSASLRVGEIKQLTAAVSPSDATNKTINWTTSNTRYATVSSDGLVTAISEGSSTIRATATDGSGVYDSIIVTVTKSAILVTSISLSPNTRTDLQVDRTLTIDATVAPSNASVKTLSWSSDDESIASVNSAGLVTANAVGEAIITASATDSSNISASVTINVIEKNTNGYTKATLKYGAIDVDNAYAPSSGNQKLLVVPISLYNTTYNDYSWTNSLLSEISDDLYGTKEESTNGWNSLSSYYAAASYGLLNITGELAPMYNAPSPYSPSYFKLTEEDDWNYQSTNMSHLYDMLSDCLSFLNNSDDINLDDYDTNNDGYIDSIHFIVNGNDDNEWGSALWPHMSQTGFSRGTVSKPTANTYSLTNLGHVDDSRTFIHEQGHIYGVDDYYNYTSESYADYVGGADMQDYNMFDWNSFSKMLMKWMEPYVLDGTSDDVTIDIRPASLYGECILLATDWNGSAYDEYILLELFSPYGNNQSDWTSWSNNYGALGTCGVRLYHVDARLWGFNDYYDIDDGAVIDDPRSNPYYYAQVGATNSANNGDYQYYPISTFSKCNLLQLIQAGGTNTFASSSRTGHYLTSSDLFKTNDTFSMSEYGSAFFSNKTKFNNGDLFPYTITFTSVTKDSASIRIVKN